MSSTVPRQVRDHVRRHLGFIHEFNGEVLRLRDLEQRVGQAGRYEADYRLSHEARAIEAQGALRYFEELAHNNDVNPQDVYQEFGGFTEPIPRSAVTEEWMHSA